MAVNDEADAGGPRPAFALALALVQRLWAGGVRDVVLAPGSRSAPLALVLDAADRAGDLRLHVRVDERSAGFLALGLSVGSHAPVAVVTTSGTAVGNLLPAVMEASHSGRRVVVVSADRPARLRGTGANQTTLQAGLYGVFAPCHDLEPGTDDDELDAAVDAALARRGPSQLNVQLDGPLVPQDDDPATWWARPTRLPGIRSAEAGVDEDGGGSSQETVTLPRGPRTVVVAGDDAGPAARLLAEAAGWPLLAEPTSGARIGEHAVRTYRLLLGTALRERVERVVVVGHPTLSRPVTSLISDGSLEVLAVRGPAGTATDPGRVARVLDAVPTVAPSSGEHDASDRAWLEAWRTADRALSQAVDDHVAGEPAGELSPLSVAAAVGRAVTAGATFVVGSSNPVRDLDVMAQPWPPHERRLVVGNRGLAGIDGLVSTAVGVALGREHASRTVAFVGDLTFLHDTNGLLVGQGQRRPLLTIVVLSDDGGAIFSTLEQGDQRFADSFERVFATPHGTDLGALCAAHHVSHERVHDLPRLESALAEQPSGIRVLEVVVSRAGRRSEARRLVDLARRLDLA
ncbi:2-succinyl-5-enolpyruvyl-6-hydroxy-3-cyclohexene-1-carboxylic-acid synthase [Terracoccus luteus]|uniref:2-succinyl-5-enolpyruvyl-6-hydroxy-3- cyclohexene-1-carboxylic-acid synthase n=1 Tax=Terracoccus luteus TaxID=53356 RepID=UPI001FECA309|nr:2-succinyl-5-enolpyruvyl-6-hydroxy-3-cyclohexene-1-carboxylic-acid synthase [Terracoccus luteus]